MGKGFDHELTVLRLPYVCIRTGGQEAGLLLADFLFCRAKLRTSSNGGQVG